VFEMPAKFTIDPAMKFVPVSVMLTDWPITPLVGLIEVSVGAGLGELTIAGRNRRCQLSRAPERCRPGRPVEIHD
jgi:hypothetical protein